MENVKQCLYCDFLNNINEEICVVCEALLCDSEYKNVRYSSMQVYLEDCKGQCKYCNSNIDEDDVICSICGTDIVKEKEKCTENVWTCSSCSFNNELHNLCCDVCFTFRDNETLQNTEVDIVNERDDFGKEEWQCRHCKNKNLFDSYMCSNCRTYAPFFHKWQCWKCSYFNEESKEICDICMENNILSSKLDNSNSKMNNESLARKSLEDYDSEDTRCNVTHKNCVYCNCELNETEKYFCEMCDKKKWFCNNKFCGAINVINTHYCRNCEVKKGANITSKNNVSVFNGKGFEKMWQCVKCGQLNNGFKCFNEKCDGFREITGLIDEGKKLLHAAYKYFKR